MTAAATAPARRPKPVPQVPHAIGCVCPKYATAACSPCMGCGRLLPDAVWRAGRDLSCDWSGHRLYDSLKQALQMETRDRAHPENRSPYWRERSDHDIGRLALEFWIEHDLVDLLAAVRHYEACDNPDEFGYLERPGRHAPRVYVLEDLAAPSRTYWLRVGGNASTGDLGFGDGQIRTIERSSAAEVLRNWFRMSKRAPQSWRLRRVLDEGVQS